MHVCTQVAQGGGLHGNAILSKYDLTDIRAIVHAHQPIDWDKEGRAGGHVFNRAVMLQPQAAALH